MPIRKRAEGSWIVDVTGNGTRSRLTFPKSVKMGDLRELEAKMLLELRVRPKLPNNVIVLQSRSSGAAGVTDQMVTRLLVSLRGGARRRGLTQDLDEATVRMMLERAGGYCELTGVPLVYAAIAGHRRNPYAPSVDRINCRLGYSQENCRIVAFAVNVAVNEWGDSVFHHIATSYSARFGAA